MRKSYHKTLADKIRELMVTLDNHYAKLSNQLNVIQLLFIETQYVKGRPPLSNATLKTMAVTYSIGARYLAPTQEMREAFKSLPSIWSKPVVPMREVQEASKSLPFAKIRFKSCFLFPPARPLMEAWFTPWQAKVILPRQLIAKVELEKLQAFFYCPSQKEIKRYNHKHWFEKEHAVDSFTYQLNSVLAIYLEEDKINSNPEPPLMPIMVVEEPTYEGLVKYLEHGQPSIGLFSDEGGRFLGGNAMNRDNLLKTLAGFSSLWDAKSNKPITRMRSSDQSLALYGRRVALHLLIQESVYSKLNQQSMCESQGFLPRCLISFPESMAGTRTYVTENPREQPGVKIFRDQCNALLDRRFPIAEPPGPKNQLAPPTISLTRDAYAKWIEFHNQLETQLGKQGAYYPIRRFGSKAAEHVLRIAGVFAIFENPSTSKVEVDHIGRAVEIIEYYLLERLRLDSYACIDPTLLTAQKVLDWAEVKGKQGVLLRDLYQYGPSDVRSKETASAILKVLEEHGRAFPVPAHEITPGGKGKAWRFTYLS